MNTTRSEDVIKLPDGRIGIIRKDNLIEVYSTQVSGANVKQGKVGFSKNKSNDFKDSGNVTASQIKIANLAVSKGITKEE